MKRSSMASAMDSRTPLSPSTTRTRRSFLLDPLCGSADACGDRTMVLLGPRDGGLAPDIETIVELPKCSDDESRKNPPACRKPAPPDHHPAPSRSGSLAPRWCPCGTPAASPRDISARGGSRPLVMLGTRADPLVSTLAAPGTLSARSGRPSEEQRSRVPVRNVRESTCRSARTPL